MHQPPRPSHCELCGRHGLPLTRHHLIPRTRHSNRRNKRDFDRNEVHTRILWVCRPCHSQIHATFTEKELEREYNTREALLAHPGMQGFTEWLRKKPPGFKPGVRRSRH
ncbi:MAG: hypothetical protein P8Y64_04470 [Gammaproteobacteria bacterium]